jgi:hypothetical protein
MDPGIYSGAKMSKASPELQGVPGTIRINHIHAHTTLVTRVLTSCFGLEERAADGGRRRGTGVRVTCQYHACGRYPFTSRVIVEPTPGTEFVGSGNRATDTANLPDIGAEGTLARMRDKALGRLDRPVFGVQEAQPVSRWQNSLGNPTVLALFRGEAPRLRGAVTPRQQGVPWLETGRRPGYNFESLLRGGQHLGSTRRRLSPQSLADLIWKARFAYNRLSDFEKTVMRRAVPFYTFTSRNIPLQRVPRPAKEGVLVSNVKLLCTSVNNLTRGRRVSGAGIVESAIFCADLVPDALEAFRHP